MSASPRMRRLVFLCLVLPLFILAEGCSREGTVSGKIYYKGQPVTGGTVYFYPEGKDGNFPSVIGTDGSYSVSKLPPGPAKISVMAATKGVPASIFRQRGGQFAEKGMKAMGKIGKAASSSGGDDSAKAEAPKENVSLPEKYIDKDQSGLSINVTGGSQTFDIKID